MTSHSHGPHCQHGHGVGGVHQTLDEMDFQRGPWQAACDGNIEGIRKYLDKRGADPSVKDSAGYTPLHYAARYGHTKIAELLLTNRSDVNAITRAGGVTPLHRGIISGNIQVVQLLLQYKADVCMQDADGRTPLHCAVQKGHVEMCRLILEHDPKCLNIKDRYSKTAREYANEEKTPLLTSLFEQFS